MEDIEELIEDAEGETLTDQEHFFGPVVVLEQGKAPHPNLKRYLIIDGQQRITTVYLMLAALKKAFLANAHLSPNAKGYAAEIDLLLDNQLKSEDDYVNLKVFSTKGDRLPTFKWTFGRNPNSPHLGEDQLLYAPDTNKVDEFVRFIEKRIKKADVPTLYAYQQAICKCLKIVWIPLDDRKDDPQAIFESLNDAGMPLSASELLCNYLFRPLTNEDTNEHEKLHNKYWLKARAEVGEERFEEYLRDLFSIGEKKRVGKDRRLYVHFKTRNRKLDAAIARQHLEDIAAYAHVYNQIVQPVFKPHPEEKLREVLIALENTNTNTVTSFTMSVLMALEKGTMTAQDARDVLWEMYVLVVRRKITNMRTTKYTEFFPSLLKAIVNEPRKVEAFQEKVRKDGLWVSDQEFKDGFLNKELYNTSELNFTRHVLQEVDRSMQSRGELPDYSTLSTIEHILPQTLSKPWREQLGDEAKNVDLLRITNTIGNLCLNSGSANSSFGQKQFDEKKDLYNPLSKLAQDVRGRTGPWNIKAIQSRSADLADKALDIWRWN